LKRSKKEIPEVLPFGPIKGVRWITKHALERFFERTSHKSATFGFAMKTIEDVLSKGLEKEPTGLSKVFKLLDHDFKAAKYYLTGDGNSATVLVVRDDILITMYIDKNGGFEEVKDG